MKKIVIFIIWLFMIVVLSTNIFAIDSSDISVPNGVSKIQTDIPQLTNISNSLGQDINTNTISNKQVNINTNTNVNNVKSLQSVSSTNSSASSNMNTTSQENLDVTYSANNTNNNDSSKVIICIGIIAIAVILFVVYFSRKNK